MKISVSLLVLVGLIVFAEKFLAPKVIVENLSHHVIKNVVVTLPKTDIEFSEIKSLAVHVVSHSPFQEEGSYQYSVAYEDGTIINGQCDTTSSLMLAERVRVITRDNYAVSCNY